MMLWNSGNLVLCCKRLIKKQSRIYNSGAQALNERDLVKAEKLLSSAIKIKPGFIQTYSSLGAALGMQGKFKEINSYLQKGNSL